MKNADVDIKIKDGLTETLCREALHIDVLLPQQYVHKAEVSARTGKFSLRHLKYDNFEFGGKAELTLVFD